MIAESHVNQLRCIEWGITLKQGLFLDFLVKLSHYEGNSDNLIPLDRNEVVSRLPVLFNRADSVYRSLKQLEKKGLIDCVFWGKASSFKVELFVKDVWLDSLDAEDILFNFSRDMQVSVASHTDPKINRKAKAVIPRQLRSLIFERDKYRCQNCDTHLNLSVDHIVPESKGGSCELSNLQTLCLTCNKSKGTKSMCEWLGYAK